MERHCAAIHKDIEQTKGEEDDAKLLHLKSAQKMLGHDLRAKN